jgi:Tfp pilus assembly protein PilV
MTLLELLAAMLVITVGLLGLFSAYGYVFTSIDRSGHITAAHQIARRGIEEVKVSGFNNTPLGSYSQITGIATYDYPARFFDLAGTELANATGARYRLDVTVVDSQVMPLSGSQTSYILSFRSRRTVSAQVTRLTDNEVVARMGTLLVRGGL